MAFANDHELLSHLYERILNRELATFADVVGQTAGLGQKRAAVAQRCFRLLRELSWGIFRNMAMESHGRLWKELVLRHEEFRDCGDLKRTITVANLYIAMLDIHGYTKFCMEARDNLSRLHQLDAFLNDGIRKIADANGTVCQRERGDEILIVGATATGTIATVLGIIDTVSREPVFRANEVVTNRGAYGITLPGFKVSAGIAGGTSNTSLIVTEQGALSGFLLNSAARLQARSNELSPHDSRIVLSRPVVTNLLKENQHAPFPPLAKRMLSLFDSGPLEFKGAVIPCCELLFRPEERYRERLVPHLTALLDAIKAGLWPQKVLSSLVDLLGEALAQMPFFSMEVETARGREPVSNTTLTVLCHEVRSHYDKEDYPAAFLLLDRLLERLTRVPGFERLFLEYGRTVLGQYEKLIPAYERRLDAEIEKQLDKIFDSRFAAAYRTAERNMEMIEKLKQTARRSPAVTTRKSIWFKLLEENAGNLKAVVHSGK